jgi:hypothetical protein
VLVREDTGAGELADLLLPVLFPVGDVRGLEDTQRATGAKMKRN